jgi:hypothetical protein
MVSTPMPRSNAAARSRATLNQCNSVVFGPFYGVFGTPTKVGITHFPLTSIQGETFALPSKGPG